jgi:hypothetical protein
MGHFSAKHGTGKAMYEITVQGAPSTDLTARFPSVTLLSTPVATILSRHVFDAAEIDDLMERLRSIGVTPLEVLADPGGDARTTRAREMRDLVGGDAPAKSRPGGAYYEFRVEGQLGESMLQYLQWPARLEEQRTVVRVLATPAEFQVILAELTGSDVQIDHFICRQAS